MEPLTMKTLESEYWLIDGMAHPADGDIDDVNHEFFVWQYLLTEFIECLAIQLPVSPPFVTDLYETISRWLPISGDPTMLRCLLNDITDAGHKRGEISEEVLDDIHYFRDLVGWNASDDHRWEHLTDSGDLDSRLWATVTLGWMRLAGNNIQFMGPLTPNQLDLLTCGLVDAHDQHREGYVNLNGEQFTLEVYDPTSDTTKQPSESTMYYDVPFPVLCDCRVMKLRPYKTQTGWAQ